jgi:diadenosine tetraphosphate (Ap4A) HIT family hydrolase
MRYETLEEAAAAGAAPWSDEASEHSDYHVAVFRDAYPVTVGHLLFVPRWNKNVIIEEAMKSAFRFGHQKVVSGEWEAYNVGINCGEAAGQTVMYPHVHLIPRRSGDCADPIGGVRGVISGQANYKAAGYQQPT